MKFLIELTSSTNSSRKSVQSFEGILDEAILRVIDLGESGDFLEIILKDSENNQIGFYTDDQWILSDGSEN